MGGWPQNKKKETNLNMISLKNPDGTVFGTINTVYAPMLDHAREADRKARQEAYNSFKAENPLQFYSYAVSFIHGAKVRINELTREREPIYE